MWNSDTDVGPQTDLLELVPDAIVGVEESGGIAFVNGAAGDLFGYTREQLVGQPLDMLLPERLREVHREHVHRYLAHPQSRPMGTSVLSARRSDGSELPVEISLGAHQTEAGAIVVAAIRDVSERMALASDRERLLAEAEQEHHRNQSNRAQRLESLGELAGGIAHDFNNLLAVIINYAAFVAEDLERATGEAGGGRWRSVREDVDQVRLAAERAAQLTHQLLAFARRELVQPEVMDVNDVVGDIEQLLRRSLGEHIELRSSLAEDLHPVLMDPGKLEQILVNLAVNARDAMPDGGVLTIDTANVDIDEDYAASRPDLSAGPHVRLRVSDTGTGMPREVAERAFDPFFSTKPPGQGTGLGLATVYGIVQQAGGRAQIYSEAGIGTTFTAVLPATDRAPSRAPAEAHAAPAEGPATILLVEDERALRDVALRILAGAGYQVLVAADGEDALRQAADHEANIDLLLSDVVMPHLHGPQLVRRIREHRPGIRVLFMSGFAEPILDAGGKLGEGETLIEKPFSGQTLLAKVAQVLTRDPGRDPQPESSRPATAPAEASQS
ncbi:MAG TPA: ATP-binding protein [Solirubrobacteraceae bacterium]|nr:ATP-binding protein [Solirubrobacteraceae bacterium]